MFACVQSFVLPEDLGRMMRMNASFARDLFQRKISASLLTQCRAGAVEPFWSPLLFIFREVSRNFVIEDFAER